MASIEERTGKGLAVVSGALGAGQLAVPGTMTRLVGLQPDPGRTLLMRLIGARELLAGGLLAAAGRPTAGAWSRVVGDGMDLGLLLAGLRSPGARRSRVVGSLAVVGLITMADVLTARALTAPASRARHGERPDEPGIDLRRAVTVGVEPEQAYATWRDLASLPRFMGHLESVEVTGPRTSRWTAKAPLGRTVSWDAELVAEEPGERLAWRSVPGSQVTNEGEVRFVRAPRDQGTEVHVRLRYEPPAGAVGSMVARLLGEEPRQQLADDLHRFEQLLETGTVVRSDGNPTGGRLPQRPAQPGADPATDGAAAPAR
jgi:uncharacterized membrane protein